MIRFPLALHNLPNAGHGLAQQIDLVIEELPDGRVRWRTEHVSLGHAHGAEMAVLQALSSVGRVNTALVDLALILHHAIDAFEGLGYTVESHDTADGEVTVVGKR